jgi:hypothetical protein
VGQGLPFRLRWQHVRCAPDSRRLIAGHEVGRVGPNAVFPLPAMYPRCAWLSGWTHRIGCSADDASTRCEQQSTTAARTSALRRRGVRFIGAVGGIIRVTHRPRNQAESRKYQDHIKARPPRLWHRQHTDAPHIEGDSRCRLSWVASL